MGCIGGRGSAGLPADAGGPREPPEPNVAAFLDFEVNAHVAGEWILIPGKWCVTLSLLVYMTGTRAVKSLSRGFQPTNTTARRHLIVETVRYAEAPEIDWGRIMHDDAESMFQHQQADAGLPRSYGKVR